MNRRRAIAGILLLGGGGLAATYIYRAINLFRNPDFKILDENRDLIEELVSTIIPRTDTPGAKEAGVCDFVISQVKYCTGKQAQNKFVTGLNDLAAYAHRTYGKTFMICSLEERIQILEYFELQINDSPGLIDKVQSRLLGDPFIVTLKRYTVLGYCTSEVGATQALAYDYIPGKFQGTTQLAPNQRAWALN